ncbi:uncharacterized protein LOC100568708 isoform X1 [Acyrthosiphon pisum]|uniref:Uncharacterized protein n=1 Tax=Acyrthosiphon pisum TaxID=7029 RepID=A0A8R2AA28_ACYPI|nr:uncharacterized protein LOC100568708 isoform X1 [Acyrthosiphon pisum]|eukprot:XP_003247786.1 PREDICTED: uncharacterized protein LOC100568708 isoform X1 [Acyrthosiphon pisum]
MAKTMADWHTPTQVERSLAAMWMKLEKSNVPLKDISEKDLISYFGNKKPVVQKLQNELLFNSNKSFDPKSKQDSWRNKKEIHDNIYEEEYQRTMPVVSSHFIGHRLKNLEGRSLVNYICKEENNK